MSGPDYWEKAARELSRRDPVLKKIIHAYRGEFLTSRDDLFYTLARSISGQQISVKAADTVWLRLVAALGSITPAAVLAAAPEQLRACGLSQSKSRYLHEAARFFTENPTRIAAWPELEDEALIREISGLHGVGRWTAEMLLIFHYLRPDVFPVADIGVLKAIQRHYGRESLTREEALALAETWRPWRTVATWHLWRALDPQPVCY